MYMHADASWHTVRLESFSGEDDIDGVRIAVVYVILILRLKTYWRLHGLHSRICKVGSPALHISNSVSPTRIIIASSIKVLVFFFRIKNRCINYR